MELKIVNNLRPCYVKLEWDKGWQKALFHCWYENRAIVEFENGRIMFFLVTKGNFKFADDVFSDKLWRNK